jgi:hypothetical protein
MGDIFSNGTLFSMTYWHTNSQAAKVQTLQLGGFPQFPNITNRFADRQKRKIKRSYFLA